MQCNDRFEETQEGKNDEFYFRVVKNNVWPQDNGKGRRRRYLRTFGQ